MKKLLALSLVLIAAALAAAALAACGGTVLDSTGTEEQLESTREKQTGEKVKEADCPSDVDVDPGTTFECTIVEAGGKQSIATLKIRNDDADLDLVSIEPANGGKSGADGKAGDGE